MWSTKFRVQIADQFSSTDQVVFGLKVEGDRKKFPLVVGASLRRRDGEVVDLPPRKLSSAGYASWEVRPIPPGFQVSTAREDGKAGLIMFALWRDASFQERLADTGWVTWEAPWLVGASTAGVEMREREMNERYGARQHVWSAVR